MAKRAEEGAIRVCARGGINCINSGYKRSCKGKTLVKIINTGELLREKGVEAIG